MPRHDSTRRTNRSATAGWLDTARHHPKATAAAAASATGAVAAGVYLWSKRNRISSQMRDWADRLQSSRTGRESMKTKGPSESDSIDVSRSTSSKSRSSRSRATASH